MIDLLRHGSTKYDGIVESLELIGALTADFIAKNDIGSVVILDTSARNARFIIKKGLDVLYPDRQVDFYFFNSSWVG